MLDIKPNKNIGQITMIFDKKLNRDYIVKHEKLKQGDKIPITSDSMFKAMFQNENRIKYSCKFLSYYLNVEYEKLLNVLRLGKNELDKKYEDNKGERCDYVAYINDSVVNIEVNCNCNVLTMERNMDYAFRLYAGNIKKGGREEYSQVIQFNINNFALDTEEVMDVFYIRDENERVLTKKLYL